MNSAVPLKLLRTTVIVGLSFALAGCVTRLPAAADRPLRFQGATHDFEWPAARTRDLDALRAACPSELWSLSAGGAERVARFRVVDARPCGNGLIRRLESAVPARGDGEFECVLFDFVCLPPGGDPPPIAMGDGRIDLEEWYGSDRPLKVIWPRTGRPCGVAIHLQPAMSTEYDGSVSGELLRRGWVVVQARCFGLRPARRIIDAADESGLDALAEEIAAGTDWQLARCAYGVEALLEYLRVTEPSLPQERVIVLGFSMGALAVPTVAARLGSRVRAALIVAGGADICDISLHTVFTRGGFEIHAQGKRITPALEQRVCTRYLARARLDPYHTAAALDDKPVLLIDGASDDYVSTRSADLLYERLHRPQRWTTPGGHASVFWLLPGLRVEICEWLEGSSASTADAVQRGDLRR